MITSNLLDFATALGFTAYVKRPTPIEGDWRLSGWDFPCLVLMPSPTADYVRQTSGTTEVRDFDILDLRATDVTFDTAEADAECETARVELLQFVQRLSEMFHVEQLRGRQIWDSANGDLVVGWSVSLRLTELVGLSACDGLPIDPKTIEITENGTYNVLPFGRAVVDVQGGTPAVVEPLEVTPDTEAHTFNPPAGVDGFAPVTVGACPVCPSPHIQPLSVTPSTSGQTFTPSAPVDGYGPVDVAAVDSTIDNNIQPQNIKAGVDILGVTGAYHGTIAPLNVSPATTAQTVTPPAGTDGFAPVTVDAVTAAIDANIQPGNIKQGVEILGVEGTLEPKDTSGDEFVVAYGGNDYTLQSDGNILATVSNANFSWAKGVWLKEAVNVERAVISSDNQRFIAPNAVSVQRQQGLTSMITLELGTLAFVHGSAWSTADNMRSFVVGQGTAINIAFSAWKATNVIAEGADAIAELNANIVAGLADRVADRTNDTALTITFGASLYNVLTAETLAAFTAKNWNVASA